MSDLKSKIKADNNDYNALACKVKEQIEISDFAREIAAKKSKDFCEKQKELADAQVKIDELNRKLDQFRNAQFAVDHFNSSHRRANDVKGLGYDNVPPPFNDNYSFLKTEVKVTDTVDSATPKIIPDTGKLPETTKSEGSESGESCSSHQKPDESVKSVEDKSQPDTLKSPSPQFQKKAFVIRSCFTCHKLGHVASCCPNRKSGVPLRQVRKEWSPAKTNSNQETASTSQPRSTGTGNRNGLGNRETPRFQNQQPRFQNRNDRPRSSSPRTSSSSGCSTSSSSQKYQPPHRLQNRFQNQGSSYRNFHNSNNNYQPRVQQNSGYQNQRPVNQRFYQKSPQNRPSGNNPFNRQSPRVSKSPERCNGYLKEFSFVDENGRPKTVMAWVPHDN